METVFDRMWRLALPYLDTRHNEVHTAISRSLAKELLRSESGQEEIVIPAVILHDTGWKSIPEALQLTAFGPQATAPGLNRRHEEEGVRIAADILRQVGYPRDKTGEILEIIDGHDSRPHAVSPSDRIVKDADRLWRFTRTGFRIDIERFQETYSAGIIRLKANIDKWLFTPTARRLALKKIEKREGERGQ